MRVVRRSVASRMERFSIPGEHESPVGPNVSAVNRRVIRATDSRHERVGMV
jgi:hypothetical protein